MPAPPPRRSRLRRSGGWRPLVAPRATPRAVGWLLTKLVAAVVLHAIGAAAMTFVLPTGEKAVVTQWEHGRMVEWYPNNTKTCDSWILVPAENMWHPALRFILYLVALAYTFVGVAVVSDTFMNAIEKITADRTVEQINDETGETYTITVTRWNPTVANLSLLALGSSAPEILLSLIETMQTLDSEPGELGPSTIVGSAAFNLLVISGLCVASVEEPKKIEEFGVFVITAVSSLFAYFWMVVTLNLWTECEVTLLEALLTLAFFPMLIVVAYLQDRGYLFGGGGGGSDGTDAGEEDPSSHAGVGGALGADKIIGVEMTNQAGEEATDKQILQLWQIMKHEKQRQQRGGKGGDAEKDAVKNDDEDTASQPHGEMELSFSEVLQGLYATRHVKARRSTSIVARARPSFVGRQRSADGMVDENDIAFARGTAPQAGGTLKDRRASVHGSPVGSPHSRARSRTLRSSMRSIPQMPCAGGGDATSSNGSPQFNLNIAGAVGDDDLHGSTDDAFNVARTASAVDSTTAADPVSLDPDAQCAVLEWGVPWVYVPAGAPAARLDIIRHGSAVNGRVTVKYATSDGSAIDGIDYTQVTGHAMLERGESQTEVVVPLLDRDVTTPRTFDVKLISAGGGAMLGRINVVTVHIDAIATLRPSIEFIGYQNGRLTYADTAVGSGTDTIRVRVEESIGKVDLAVGRRGGLNSTVSARVYTTAVNAADGKDFESIDKTVEMGEGEAVSVVSIGILDTQARRKDVAFEVRVDSITDGVDVGATQRVAVQIVEDTDWRLFYARVEELVATKQVPAHEMTWREQFHDCFEVHGDSLSSHWFHFFTFFWRCLCAAIPPTQYAGGWLTFVFTLVFIAGITVVVIELANLLGCCVGLKNSVTAISLVALGTSLPDTFASKTTAEEEETADAAIGNVTGSNCVNIFLGLGLPWTIAAVYKQANDEVYFIPAGDLVYSVVLFLGCALVGLAMLVANRLLHGGELGGPYRHVIGTCFVLLWLFYLIMSALKAYGHVGGGVLTGAGDPGSEGSGARTC